MALLKFLVLLTIMLLPIGELGRYIFPSVGFAPLVLNDIAVGSCVGYWLGYKLHKKQRIGGLLSVPIFIFLVICIVSLLVNIFVLSAPQFVISSLYIFRWGMYAGLYFVVRDFSSEFKQKIVLLLLSIGQVTIFIGYVQYLYYPSLRNLYYLGWDEHLYRMFSVFLDPNFAGAFFVLVFLLTFGKGWKNYREKRFLLSSMFFILSFLDVVAVYLTYSRTSLIMLTFALLIFLWISGMKRYIVAVLISLLFLLFLLPKSFQTEGTNILRIASSEARVKSVQTAIEIIQKNPLFGVGFNAYRYAQNRYGYLRDSKWNKTHAGAGTDNSYLFVLATTGIVGMSAYLFLLYRMVLLSQRKRNTMHAVVFSSLIGIFISSLFINSLFYIFIMEWLWILLGITESTSRE